MYVTWLGGQGGRHRDRTRRKRGDLRLHSLDEQGLVFKLVDLLEGAADEASPLPVMLRRLHEQSQGKLLCLVLLRIHSVYSGTLDVLNLEQRLGMYYAKLDGHTPIFLEVVAASGLRDPVDAIYRGPSFPKVVAFEVTPACVTAALDSDTSDGRPARDVLETWRARPVLKHDA